MFWRGVGFVLRYFMTAFDAAGESDTIQSYEILGVTSEEVHGFAFQALTRRLKVIGVSLAPAEEEPVPA